MEADAYESILTPTIYIVHAVTVTSVSISLNISSDIIACEGRVLHNDALLVTGH